MPGAGERRARRLIPAGAGKTILSVCAQSTISAHPRRCGENSCQAQENGGHGGSSPQVRGKPGQKGEPGVCSRLIPAGAGKTALDHAGNNLNEAHPRRCGENSTLILGATAYFGSSPQVRGKQAEQQHGFEVNRLIPAGAGKTRGYDRSITYRAAHPRRCGENVEFVLGVIVTAGSSPQVRGKRIVIITPVQPVRLIPAGAGKTSNPNSASANRSAHPRRCGENVDSVIWAAFFLGSSPQVRGKRAAYQASERANRLIPAGAGKT